MIGRCHRKSNISYKHYGKRGIKVCREWRKSFLAFYRHIGPAPSKIHQVDRYPNNDGDYEPGNVRWATPKENSNNKPHRRK